MEAELGSRARPPAPGQIAVAARRRRRAAPATCQKCGSSSRAVAPSACDSTAPSRSARIRKPDAAEQLAGVVADLLERPRPLDEDVGDGERRVVDERRVVAAGADLLGPDPARDVDQHPAAVALAVDVARAVEHLLEVASASVDRLAARRRVLADRGVDRARVAGRRPTAARPAGARADAGSTERFNLTSRGPRLLRAGARREQGRRNYSGSRSGGDVRPDPLGQERLGDLVGCRRRPRRSRARPAPGPRAGRWMPTAGRGAPVADGKRAARLLGGQRLRAASFWSADAASQSSVKWACSERRTAASAALELAQRRPPRSGASPPRGNRQSSCVA